MIFNFGIETFKNSREIASKEENKSNFKIERIIIADLFKGLNKRRVKHGVKPTKEEQFLFGFLKGNYRFFKVEKNMMSLHLKQGERALRFITEAQKKDLAQKFKNIYLGKGVSLVDSVENRFVASKHLSYSLIQNNTILGELSLKFSQDQGLLKIVISGL